MASSSHQIAHARQSWEPRPSAALALLRLACGDKGETVPPTETGDDTTTTPITGDTSAPGDTAGPEDSAPPPPEDLDGDGFTVEEGDCDDGDPQVHPGDEETCDGQDQDCDGEIDEGEGEPGLRYAGWMVAATDDMVWEASSQTLVDVDGDGLLDLLACSSSRLYCFHNPGSPWIVGDAWVDGWETLLESSEGCEGLDNLDYDGDGNPDLVTRKGDSLILWQNDGTGGFPLEQRLGVGLEDFATLAVGDFDGNGWTDVAVAPKVFWNEGGSFTEAAGPCPSTSYRWSAAPLLTDGQSALFCESGSYNYTADSSRAWTRIPIAPECAHATPRLLPDRAGDLDGDGLLDTLMGTSTLLVCSGDGAGDLTRTSLLAWSEHGLLVSGIVDVDGDGLGDAAIAACSEAPDIRLLHGAVGGPELIAEINHFQINDQGGAAIWADLDGDGAADLLAVRIVHRGASVHRPRPGSALPGK